MNKTLEKILEDELFENQVFEGEGNIQIKNTSAGTKMPITPIGYSYQKITEQGKNRFNLANVKEQEGSTTTNKAKVELIENGFKLTKVTPKDNLYGRWISGISCSLKAGEYTVCYNLKNSDASNTRIRFAVQKADGSDCASVHLLPSNTEVSLTLPEDGAEIQFCFLASADAITSEITDLMIISAEEKDKTYEPFVPDSPSPEYPSEIRNCGDINTKILNSNFFNLKNMLFKNTNIQFTKIDDSNFDLSTEANVSWQTIGFEINVIKNTDYILSFIQENSITDMIVWLNIASWDNVLKKYTNAIYNGSLGLSGAKNKQFNTGDTNKIQISFYAKASNIDGTNIAKIRNVMLRLFTSKDTFMLNEEQNNTFPTKEGQVFHKDDYLANDGTHQVKNTIELDGEEEGWLTDESRCNDNSCWFNNNKITKDIKDKVLTSGEILCTHFKNYNCYGESQTKDGICFHNAGSGIQIRINNSYLEDISSKEAKIESLKKFLKNQKEKETPVVIEYPLAEEKIEPYSPEQKEAHTKLMQATAYENETNIICTDEIKCSFKVNAKISKIKKMEGEK